MKKRKKIIRKKRTKKVRKRRRLKKVPKSFKRKLRFEVDMATSTKVTSLSPLGWEFKSQVFIKDNKKKRILNGPIDFDHAVAIIDHYNNNPKKALSKWLVGR